jgi:predicted nuclease of predicted toxin-antitoxin system
VRLLLDEMLSPAIAGELRARGYDVEAIKEHAEWRAYADPQVLDLARRERRALVTDNLVDTRALHYE